ncbi:hypothetical protein OROGR_029579 [Orobanche gracilis]
MPQADLETLDAASTCHDRTISRRTALEGTAAKNDVISDDHAGGILEPDLPPESFWLSNDEEYDWFDRNAVYEWKESTRGNSNSTDVNPNINNSNSQRSSVKSKASIIGLPKIQKNTFVDLKWRTCKVVNTRLFPKREKSPVQETEPGSPKVSCIGRVRSKHSRRLSNSLRANEKMAGKLKTGGEEQKSNFCSDIMCVFWLKKGHRKPAWSGRGKVVEMPEEELVVVDTRRKSVSLNVLEIPADVETVAESSGLGVLFRLASERRSANCAAVEINQAI